MKTYIARENEIEQSRRWYVVDAEGQVLGRLASKIAHILRGKNKPIYSPHQDAGDFIVVINAEKVRLTGKKMQQKTYFRHSGYPGGVTTTPIALMLQRHPERVIEYAVKRMLPKNALGRKMFKKLKVYAGPDHPHQAQQPAALKLN
ncbi:MAG TPA: 50S ribosomal protein L13 [Caldithrix abyssi]|uniref:Large ribosomal subunit protein uL13 n=1 Tax=Caldithrix abyssi TaxID=187145 RepID=A0A7V4U1R2_CALAY|nr:50S ribosomal protein L13 [Caldithrix abyssi]